MPPELQAIPRSSISTGPTALMRELDQTGESGGAPWIRLGDAQCLPYNREAACAQRALVRVVDDLFSGAVAASTNTPRGLRLTSFILDSGCFLPPAEEARPSDEPLRRPWQQIGSRLDEEPLEDGVTHSAETLVAEALSGPAGQRTAFARRIETEPSPELSASMLRLAGRVARVADRDWRGKLVERALRASSAKVREAAVEAVEHWEDPALLPLLRAHVETVSWLKAYIDDVIEDLSE